MKTSSFKQAIEAQFDCLSKKVIKRAVKKGYRDMKRREKRECPFSDIPDYEQERFGTFDKYESDYTVFNILGIEVWVEDDQLSEVLKTLTEKKRNIILLSYFMDMSDSEISEFIKIPRSNVQYHRTKTLETMKKIIIGTALAAGYLILCRLMRGYWALDGDLIVIAMATAAYLILDKLPERDQEEKNNEPTYIKVAKGTDGIEKVS